MELTEAKSIIKNFAECYKDGRLRSDGQYVFWNPGEYSINLDGYFDPNELEALACWMRGIKKMDKDG